MKFAPDNGPMTLIHSTEQLLVWRSSLVDKPIALVPTMGALHSGHTALVNQAARQCDIVVVSIFVNALQFTDDVDFAKYPRSLESDYEASIRAGASLVFAPSSQDMFPADFDDYITPTALANSFEGASRPGHFAGVVTVVHRLFNLIQPHIAIFGAKDFQQVAVIRAMAATLHPTTEIYSADTVRDTDGLALSSRNARLSPTARKQARVIPAALFAMRNLFDSGQTDSSILKQMARDTLISEPHLHVEYLEIVGSDSLEPQDDARTAVVLFAGNINGVRLIDNIQLH